VVDEAAGMAADHHHGGRRTMKQVRTNTLHRSIVGILRAGVLAAALGLCVSGTAIAQASDPATFDIPQQPLPAALKAFAEQSGMQLLYRPETLHGTTFHALNGKLDKRQALRMLLDGSGLEAVYSTENAATIRPRSRESSTKEGYTGAAGATEADPPAAGEAATGPFSSATDPDTDKQVKLLEAVTVTGTRIRGGSTPSPVITIGSEQMEQEGFTNLGEVIRSVPQNFNGGQNPGVVGATGGFGNQNFTGGSALNLRGLGADASLTLLNGHRLAYDGFAQAVDISAIPVEAVERLEIVPDGASAIYGSDAVGGVANVVLKRDYDGVALGARYGGATDGGLMTREYTATAGTTWASGGLIATYKDTSTDPIYTRQRSYTERLGYQGDPYTIYNGSGSRSGLVSVHQSMGDMAELRLDALETKRDMTGYTPIQAGSSYRYTPDTSIALVSPSIEFFLRNDWSITLGGAYGKDDMVDVYNIVSEAGITLDTRTWFRNKTRSWEIGAEGPLFTVGGGEARLAVGAGVRNSGLRVMPEVSGTGDAYGGNERARFAYAELGVPFVSPSSGISGVRRLEFSAAIRGEDYASFGRVATPKFGVIYDPTADLTLKASWGKSFKAPLQFQRYAGKTAYLFSASMVGAGDSPADATALMSVGDNPDLHAERARTWNASLVLHPEALPGFEGELTWFHIDYIDRVAEPVIYQRALSDPAYAGSDFVDRSPTPGQIQEFLSVYGSVLYNYSGGDYDPDKVVAIIHDEYVNVARQRIKGLDLSGSYHFDLGDGHLTVRGSASWLDSAQTTVPGQPEQTLAGTVFNPARLKGRVGAIWMSGGFTASGFVNYIGGVTNRLPTATEKTASFTTVDTTINYDTGEGADAFSGMTFGLSVQNLLNRAPPLFTALYATYVPYDATNYSAIGRFVSISVSKHW
jgi:outer membrane receptor protein involved in Fe transport